MASIDEKIGPALKERMAAEKGEFNVTLVIQPGGYIMDFLRNQIHEYSSRAMRTGLPSDQLAKGIKPILRPALDPIRATLSRLGVDYFENERVRGICVNNAKKEHISELASMHYVGSIEVAGYYLL